MQPEIIKQLKKLKSIRPETNFVFTAKQNILTTPQKRFFTFTYFQTRFLLTGTTIVLLLTLTLSIANLSKTSSLSKNFFSNPEEITREFENLDINIQLQEINYRQNINEIIALALNEITDKEPTYLKSSILENELNSFKINNNTEKNEKIEELLNKIIF